MKKCPVCGRSNTDDSKFCESCGNQFEDDRSTNTDNKTVVERFRIYLRNGDAHGLINKKRLFAFVAAVYGGMFVLMIAFGFVRAAWREKQVADMLASRSAYESGAVTKCKVCHGDGNDCTNCSDGRCPNCKGSGKTYVFVGYKNGQPVSDGPYKCQVCNGYGKCTVCQGKGSCSACHSTGVVLKYSGTDYCKTCKGTGFCLKCDGKGCSSCDNGYCATCNRTGQAQ